MDIAIVTGASSALGMAISSRLIQLGFRVYGLGGDYQNCPLKNVNFKPLACDLSDALAVEAAANRILEKEKGVVLLVNNAKFFARNSFAEMGVAEMERIVRINLLCPLVLARTLQKSLSSLQGGIINLGSASIDSSRDGAVGAAASGGLKWMSEALFNSLRDKGVKVTHISPEPNRVRGTQTTVRKGAQIEASLDPEAVAQAVEQIVHNPFGNIVTELVLRPLRTNEPQQDPVVHLPVPEPQPIPYTVPREVIEAEEELEEQAFEAAREKKKARRKARTAKKKEAAKKEAPTELESAPEAAEPVAGPSADTPETPTRPETGPSDAVPSPAQRPGFGKRRRRKPKPPMTQVGFLKQETVVETATDFSVKESPSTDYGTPSEPTPAAKTAPAADSLADASAKSAGRPRKAARKSVRKSAKKASRKVSTEEPAVAHTDPPAAAKKTTKKATKKAVRKVATKKGAPAKKATARKRAAKKATKENKSS